MKHRGLGNLPKLAGEFPCTQCGGDATIAYIPTKVKRGRDKGKEVPSWDGLVKPNERLCLACGKKRGIKFF